MHWDVAEVADIAQAEADSAEPEAEIAKQRRHKTVQGTSIIDRRDGHAKSEADRPVDAVFNAAGQGRACHRGARRRGRNFAPF